MFRCLARAAALASIVLMGAPAVPVQPALAQTAAEVPAARIGVFARHKIYKVCKAAAFIEQERTKYTKAYEAAAAKEEQALAAEYQELQRQRAVLSAEAFQQKYRDFADRKAGHDRKWEIQRRKLDLVLQRAYAQFEDGLREAALKIAEERGLNVVMDDVNVYAYLPAMDISDAIAKHIDKILTKVEFPNPETVQIGQRQ